MPSTTTALPAVVAEAAEEVAPAKRARVSKAAAPVTVRQAAKAAEAEATEVEAAEAEEVAPAKRTRANKAAAAANAGRSQPAKGRGRPRVNREAEPTAQQQVSVAAPHAQSPGRVDGSRDDQLLGRSRPATRRAGLRDSPGISPTHVRQSQCAQPK